MLTIPTAAANPLNNCRRLYPSMDSSPFPYVVGSDGLQLLRFYFECAGEITGGMPRMFMVPAVIARRWHPSLRKRGFGTSRWLMRTKTIPVSGKHEKEDLMFAFGPKRT